MEENWQIELYQTRRGDKPVEDFLNTLEAGVSDKVYASMQLLREFGLGISMPHVKKVKGSSLWELRSLGKSNVRIFYIAKQGKTFLLLHGFKKKSQKTPEKEIKIAKQRLIDSITKL